MTTGADPALTARQMFDAYRAQDRETAEELLAPDFVFTSPQDDHIDRAAYFARCFPTADRFTRQELLHVVEVGGGDVLMVYEYDVRDGGTFRNAELVTIDDGRLTEVQVFFGGAVR
ncbi:nuclear transport factor 2 family protein [Mumia sp. DW29H23]|uniref:nuclear transport factor 2 family protein n=1 Tax=Mumia sp. DW29H23 TaxID=3421241 RepID=UPI003D691610